MDLRDRDKKKIRLMIIGGAIICFAYIAYMVSANDVLAFDTVIREWAYSRRCPWLNRILITITYMGNWQSITVLALALLILPKTRRTIGLPFAVTSISSTVCYKLVKECFQRPRPDLAVRIIEQGGYSFPSGHSMNGLVCFGMLIYLIRRYCRNKKTANVLTVLLVLLVILIGCSRVYVGVHFPTDILGGWSLGLAFLMTAILIFEKIRGDER